jgi:hypothetical protein
MKKNELKDGVTGEAKGDFMVSKMCLHFKKKVMLISSILYLHILFMSFLPLSQLWYYEYFEEYV